jgi:predicted ATP-dependent endonuclease of OLD family
MKIREIALHNYRSIKDAEFYVADYGLLIGGNNSGKTSVLDALRNFYEKDIKFDQLRDFPKFPTDDKQSWVEIEYEMTKEEADSIKVEYRQAGNRFRVRKVLHSDDKTGDDKVFHDGVNKLIQDKQNPFTQKIHVLPDDLEKFLGFAVPDKDHRKPSRLLLALKESKIDAAKVEALCKLVEELAGVQP